MKVNQANLVKGLKYSFTNKTTVLGELMQNARRAGASQVIFDFDPETKVLRVSDDGCGIDSIETLLTVAESGWDANMAAKEHPFGIGFLSALFMCHHLTVTSKGGCISADTDDVLSFKPVSVTAISNWDGNTEITMQGVDLEENHIRHVLENLARGFIIPVIFNDERLESPLSINSKLQFEDTEIGLIYLCGLDTYPANHCDYEVFLQGLPIYHSRQYFHGDLNHHVIHLDSASFYARLPDRDKLIDQDEVVIRIKEVLAKEIEKHLISMKSTLSEIEFVDFYPIMNDWGLLRLLNDVSLVPPKVLSEITDYPVYDTDAFGSFKSRLTTPLSRDEIKSRGIVSINENIQDEGSAHYMFAWKRKYLVFDGHLDEGHWLHTLARKFDDGDISIEIINESHQAMFKGNWVWLNTCFCDAYQIHMGDEMIEITDMGMFTGQSNDDMAIIPNGDEESEDVIKQAYSFRNEYDEFQEVTWTNDSEAFSSFVVANTSKEPAEAMKRLLPNFKGCPSLYGGSFVLKLNEEGEVASVIVD